MRLVLDTETTFVPGFRGNGDDKEPVTITLRQLTTGQRQRLMALDPVNLAVHEATKGQNGAATDFEFDVDYEGIFRAAVVRIDNLVVNGEPIQTAAGLLAAPGLNDLFMETIMEIVQQNARKEGDLKN